MFFEANLNTPIKGGPFYFRPVCLITVVFLVTMAAQLLLGVSSSWVYIIVILYCIFLFIRAKSMKVILPWLLLITLLLSFIRTSAYITVRERTVGAATEYTSSVLTSEEDGEEQFNVHYVKLQIESVYYCESYGSSYYAVLREIDGKEATGYAVLCADEPLNAEPYDVVYCNAELSEYTADTSELGEMYILSNDILLQADLISDITFTNEAHSRPSYYFYLLRQKMSGILESSLTSSASAFAKALMFGDRSSLSASFIRDSAAIGISHLMAVSGMHVSIISSFVLLFFKKVRFSRRLLALPTALVALLYSAICASPPSALRAAFMLLASAVVLLAGYKPDPINSLFISVGVICFLVPKFVLSVALMLSFASTLGILLVSDILGNISSAINNMIGFPRYILLILQIPLASIFTSAAAILFTLPISVLCFGEISVVGILSNLLLSPFVTAAMILGVTLLILHFLPPLDFIIIKLFELVYSIIEGIVTGLASAFNTTASLKYSFVIILLILCLSSFLYLRLLNIQKRVFAFIPLICLVFLVTACTTVFDNTLEASKEVSTVTVGKNEAIVIFNGSEIMICDFSDGTQSIATEAADAAKSRYYATRIDAYMLTHYHSRHISTVSKLLREEYINTLYLPLPETDTESSFAGSIKKLADKFGCTVIYYESDEAVLFGEIQIYTARSSIERSTHPTLYMQIVSDELSFLYIGASALEGDMTASISERAASGGTVYLGIHGPVQSSVTALPILSDVTEIYASPSNSADAELSDVSTLKNDSDTESVVYYFGSG